MAKYNPGAFENLKYFPDFEQMESRLEDLVGKAAEVALDGLKSPDVETNEDAEKFVRGLRQLALIGEAYLALGHQSDVPAGSNEPPKWQPIIHGKILAYAKTRPHDKDLEEIADMFSSKAPNFLHLLSSEALGGVDMIADELALAVSTGYLLKLEPDDIKGL